MWCVRLQVLNVSLLEGEVMTVEDMGGRESSILANETVLMRGLVVRSWSNQISIRYRSDQQPRSGSLLLLRYQGEVTTQNHTTTHTMTQRSHRSPPYQLLLFYLHLLYTQCTIKLYLK